MPSSIHVHVNIGTLVDVRWYTCTLVDVHWYTCALVFMYIGIHNNYVCICMCGYYGSLQRNVCETIKRVSQSFVTHALANTWLSHVWAYYS